LSQTSGFLFYTIASAQTGGFLVELNSMNPKIKILFFLILIMLFFSVSKVKAVGELTYLNIFLRGDCFPTVKLPDNTIGGMDFEKGYATVPQKAVYSGLYMQPQYLIFINPDPGAYYISIVSNREGICELEVQLMKGSATTFSKTLSENLKKGEIREAAFTLYKFENYDPTNRIYDVTYQIWNIAPGSGKEALSEGFHKPYLEIIPNFIKIGILAGENQEIPIIIKTPPCIPPSGTSCSIIPAKNITFSLHDIPEEYVTFSENDFLVEASSSKIIKLKIKTPQSTNQLEGYIYVKSSIGENIIGVNFTSDEITETEPPIELPLISFDTEKIIAKFMKLSKNVTSEIETPTEMDLPITNIKFQAINDLQDFKITMKSLKEEELINKNIKKINKKSYNYVEIVKENINDQNITTAYIGFRVNKNWIRENKINLNRVKLFKFENNSWRVLKTEKIFEDGSMVYYKAFSPGLSIFVIAEKSLLPFQWYFIVIPIILIIILMIFIIILKKIKYQRIHVERK